MLICDAPVLWFAPTFFFASLPPSPCHTSVSISLVACATFFRHVTRLDVRFIPLRLPRCTLSGEQKFQGEDMMSPAAFQPKPEVSDLEMAGGERTRSARDLYDEPSPERKVTW